MTETDIDQAAAHKYFAGYCFNKAWELIDKEERTPEEDQEMLQLNQASIWHWTNREDCTDKNLSIGYWQASRIYALLGQCENARESGHFSLAYSKDEGPFYQAYAHEALARAEFSAGNRDGADGHLREARALSSEINDPEERKMLEDDLDSIA